MLALLLLLLAAAPVHALFTTGATPIGPSRMGAELTLVSADGSHYAELVQGERDAWYVDGRKVAEERKGTFLYNKSRYGSAEVEAALGSDGRLSFARRIYDDSGAPAGFAVVTAGRQGPRFDSVGGLKTSPSGAHVAYAGKDTSWRVVADGAIVASHGEQPASLDVDDAGRVVYLALQGNEKFMYLSGKPLRPWKGDELALAPGWRGIAGKWSGSYARVLLEDDRSYGPYTTVSGVRFSADGRRVFHQAWDENGDKIYLDGKPFGPARVNALKEGALMPPARLAWFAEDGGTSKLFVDGRPTVAVPTPVSVGAAPGGEHYAAVGYAGSSGKLVWVADGQAAEGPDSILSHARIVFDSAEEFHVLTTKGGVVRLSCLSFSQRSAEGSTCMSRARRKYKPFDEDDPDFDGTGVVRRVRVKR